MSFISCDGGGGGGGGVGGSGDPGGRLTLTSGVPVTTVDVVDATTIYYCPYVSNTIALWDGSAWTVTTFSEITFALGAGLNGVYDIFGYLSGGALTLEKLVWTNNTTRATDITLQDGRYCKSGDKTRLYLGSFKSTSGTTTEDSGSSVSSTAKRFLWNMYNRVSRYLNAIDTTNNWSYTTQVIRYANNSSGNRVEYLCGLAVDSVNAALTAAAYLSLEGFSANVGIGVDSNTAFSGHRTIGFFAGAGGYVAMMGNYKGIPGLGYHYLAWLEYGGDGICTFFGDNGSTTTQCGLSAEVWA